MGETKTFRDLIALAAMPIMLICVEIGGVFLAAPMIKSGYAVFEDPSSVTNPIWFIAMILGFTLLLLILMKYKFKNLLQIFIWASLFLSFIYVYSGILLLAGVSDIQNLGGGLILAIFSTIILYRYPEWYVVDILGVLLSAGIASIFGISLEPLPVIILLILLAIYDAISVYRTKHMLTLAEGIVDNRMPIMVVVPRKEGYSYIRDGIGGKITERVENERTEEKSERGAYLMGYGDLIMPAILVISAAAFLQGRGIGPFCIPAIGAMIGSLAGMLVLLYFVSGGRPQAGLPPLNGGAILGFLIGYLLW